DLGGTREAARGLVGCIAELGDGRVDELPRLLAHVRFVVDHAGNGHRRDARVAGHVADGRRAAAPPRPAFGWVAHDAVPSFFSCTCVQPVLLTRSRIITRSGAPVAVVAASGPPDVIIDDVLQPLLLAAPLLGLPVLDGDGAQVREGELAALELAPAAFVQTGIAALPELR